MIGVRRLCAQFFVLCADKLARVKIHDRFLEGSARAVRHHSLTPLVGGTPPTPVTATRSSADTRGSGWRGETTAVVVQINRRRKESAEKDALALDLKR